MLQWAGQILKRQNFHSDTGEEKGVNPPPPWAYLDAEILVH
jgi:hypothetical protein